jgi:hypothetical protein
LFSIIKNLRIWRYLSLRIRISLAEDGLQGYDKIAEFRFGFGVLCFVDVPRERGDGYGGQDGQDDEDDDDFYEGEAALCAAFPANRRKAIPPPRFSQFSK